MKGSDTNDGASDSNYFASLLRTSLPVFTLLRSTLHGITLIAFHLRCIPHRSFTLRQSVVGHGGSFLEGLDVIYVLEAWGGLLKEVAFTRSLHHLYSILSLLCTSMLSVQSGYVQRNIFSGK